jgi:hypothetical protein
MRVKLDCFHLVYKSRAFVGKFEGSRPLKMKKNWFSVWGPGLTIKTQYSSLAPPCGNFGVEQERSHEHMNMNTITPVTCMKEDLAVICVRKELGVYCLATFCPCVCNEKGYIASRHVPTGGVRRVITIYWPVILMCPCIKDFIGGNGLQGWVGGRGPWTLLGTSNPFPPMKSIIHGHIRISGQ